MTDKEEKYVHFVSCIENLNEAWRILQDIIENKDNPLARAAFQFLLIEYSKPYKESRGNAKSRHKLDDTHVPDEHKALHKRILDFRDQVNAHTDLTIKEANLIVARLSDGSKCATLIQNKIHGTQEIQNIGDIDDLIVKTLDSMYRTAKELESVLPINNSYETY